MSYLSIEDLHVSYKREDKKRAYAVQGLNLQLGRQETLGIIGETGAGKTTTAFWAIVIVQTWKQSGYMMLIYIAGLVGVSQDYIEAARIDGE